MRGGPPGGPYLDIVGCVMWGWGGVFMCCGATGFVGNMCWGICASLGECVVRGGGVCVRRAEEILGRVNVYILLNWFKKNSKFIFFRAGAFIE